MVRRTMYQPLVEYLAIQSERDVTLSFGEIEAIIGTPLSVSALVDAGLWHATTQPHVRRWREMGWRALRPAQDVRPLHAGGVADATLSGRGEEENANGCGDDEPETRSRNQR